MYELAPPPTGNVRVVALAAFPLMLLFLALGFAFAFWVVRRHRKLRAQLVTPRPGYAMEISWLAAPLVVAAAFAGISANESSRLLPDSKRGSPSGQPIQTAPQLPQPSPVGMKLTATGAGSPSHRPAWTEQVKNIDGDCQYVVVSSQQYSTREEAEAELSSRAAELIRDDLQRIRPEAPQSSWRPSMAEIQRWAVKQQYVEAVERDFGSFFHPMYRVWWQVELSPEVRTEFLPSWRQGLTNSRVRGLGLMVSSVVLIASLLAMYRRLDVMTDGNYRKALTFGAGVISLLWFSVVRIAFNHWL